MTKETVGKKHKTISREAKSWKTAIIVIGLLGLSGGIAKHPGLWSGYALDVFGPAWIYILIRAQYKSTDATFFNIKFSPESAAFVVVGICFLIEGSQYLELYDSYFDPYDLIAYVSLVIPLYIIDKRLISKRKNQVLSETKNTNNQHGTRNRRNH